MAGGFHTYAHALGCSAGPMAGTQALETAGLGRWGVRGVTSLGIFNCRKVEGTETWSVHAEGRALDLEVSDAPSGTGAQLVAELLARTWDLGLQRLIFARQIWDEDSPFGRDFDDQGAHDTHVHIEQARGPAWALTESQAVRLWPPFTDTAEDDEMQLIVRWGGLWVVAADLSSKTPLASTADVQALQESGNYRLTALTPAQMVKIPTADLTTNEEQVEP